MCGEFNIEVVCYWMLFDWTAPNNRIPNCVPDEWMRTSWWRLATETERSSRTGTAIPCAIIWIMFRYRIKHNTPGALTGHTAAHSSLHSNRVDIGEVRVFQLIQYIRSVNCLIIINTYGIWRRVSTTHKANIPHAVHAKCEYTWNAAIKPIVKYSSVWHAQIVARSHRFGEFTYRLIPMCCWHANGIYRRHRLKLPAEKSDFRISLATNLVGVTWNHSRRRRIDAYFY